ncbi:MAG: UPF0158 family protein [Actinomycetota bacterium]
MDQEEFRTKVRSAVVRRDGEELVDVLTREGWPDHSLQLVGDGLAAAVAENVPGAVDLARRCVVELRERGWWGDYHLAEALDARLGNGPTPLLRPLPVDLEDLASILEGDPVHGGGRIDLTNGEVWHQSTIEYAEEVGELDPEEDDPERWLYVECEGSRDGYRDMEEFIELVDDERLAGRLEVAISGRGAFRRFKDVLWDQQEPLTLWYAFSDDRQRGRARAWLAEQGYRPSQGR